MDKMNDTLTNIDMHFDVELKKVPTSAENISDLFKNLGFGKIFSDHMAAIQWSEDRGWHSPKISERKPFSIDPASAALHYAQEIFEGLKSYRSTDNRILLFRPEENARRFALSAERMGMPILPETLFVNSVKELMKVDRHWIPRDDGSLYVRPFMFSHEVFLGMRPAKSFIFCVIASPVDAYFRDGKKPISLWVSNRFSRAGPGGTGSAKCGGNYGASMAAHIEATVNGCDQAVFLDASRKKWVEELGGMNIFFVMDDGSLVTPPLNGCILRGITRDSIMTLATARGVKVHERRYSFIEWRDDAASGRMSGAFACGTAAVITQVGSVRYAHGEFTVPTDGPNAAIIDSLKAELIGIQTGSLKDIHNWVHEI
jgi:branched-chain amino acid aminotransferase